VPGGVVPDTAGGFFERELCSRGLAVDDHFLGEREIAALSACAEERHRRGEFTDARIGAAGALQRRADIRGDSICWLAEPLFPAEQALLASFESLRLALNREAQLGLFELEIHYASYPPGAGYERHVDQPQGSTARTVTLVLYLNVGWSAASGGELRIFLADAARDILPLGGRLVCFLTRGLEHAVMPALCRRLSITGWFRTRGA
jgi:SM-20-related protein